MRLCTHCEVEVEEGVRHCPLCRNPLERGAEDPSREPEPPPRDPHVETRRIRRWLLEVLSILGATGALVVVVADVAADMSLSWARYPLASIAFVWLSAVLSMFHARRAWVYLPVQVGAACLFLFVLDRVTSGPAWFLPVAFPVTVLIGAIVAATFVIVRKAQLSPVATVAAAIVAAGVFVVGLELILNRFHTDRWIVGWSAVAFACTLPFALMLLLLRKWLRARQGEIRKLLHL